MHHRQRTSDTKLIRRFLDDPRLSLSVLEAALAKNDIPRNVSAVIATYNRCPYDPATPSGWKNPLHWCLDTLVASKACPLREIVIVNDGSTDYTSTLLDSYRAGRIPLQVVTLPHRHGSGLARNIGVRHATSDLCLICDDDALPAPLALSAGAQLLTAIRKTDVQTAVLQFPVYLRTSQPAGLVRQTRIGRCDVSRGITETHFHRVPREYLTHPVWSEDGLLAPFRITNLIGVFLGTRAALLDVGGFPDFPWRNGSYEEAELALRLTAAGYTLWFSPDPRLHFCHLQYGATANLLRSPPEGVRYGPYELAELVRESARPRMGTGNRVSVEECFTCKVMSRFVVFGTRSRRGAWLWALRALVHFVLLNRTEFTGTIRTKVDRLFTRARLWSAAVRHGTLYLRRSQQPFGQPIGVRTFAQETEPCPFPIPSRDSTSSPSGAGLPPGSFNTRETSQS